MKNLVIAASLVTAAVVGCSLPTAKGPVASPDATPWARCTDTAMANGWHAEDLCDTLPPNVKVTPKKWDSYNRANGWERDKSPHCWTTTTTADFYEICFSGSIDRLA